MTPQEQNIWNFMVDYARSTNKLPGIRTISKGLNIGIRETRRRMNALEDAGMIRRTIHGWAPPKGYKAPEAAQP